VWLRALQYIRKERYPRVRNTFSNYSPSLALQTFSYGIAFPAPLTSYTRLLEKYLRDLFFRLRSPPRPLEMSVLFFDPVLELSSDRRQATTWTQSRPVQPSACRFWCGSCRCQCKGRRGVSVRKTSHQSHQRLHTRRSCLEGRTRLKDSKSKLGKACVAAISERGGVFGLRALRTTRSIVGAQGCRLSCSAVERKWTWESIVGLPGESRWLSASPLA
jgi:hypothetical protein